MDHLIELPNALKVHNFEHLFRHLDLFPAERPNNITLSFHPRFTNMEPWAVSMLAAWGHQWTTAQVPIRCKNADKKGVAYAQRLGLFNFIPHDGLVEVEEHEEAGRFITVKHIKGQADMSKLIAELGGILRDPELIRVGQYAVSEMTRNVLEHANADAFVCAQYYPKTKHVSIGVADCGRGIRQSLAESYGFGTHEEAILGALRPGVSGRSRNPYGASDNAGLGLFVARTLAKASRQYFMIASGDAAYRQSKITGDDLRPKRNPSTEKHKLLNGLKGWPGTLVAIDLRGMGQTFKAVMRTVTETLSDTDEAKAVRSSIRFTK